MATAPEGGRRQIMERSQAASQTAIPPTLLPLFEKQKVADLVPHRQPPTLKPRVVG